MQRSHPSHPWKKADLQLHINRSSANALQLENGDKMERNLTRRHENTKILKEK
jgi:hypothetical protein